MSWIISEGTPTDYGGRTVRIELEPRTIKPVVVYPPKPLRLNKRTHKSWPEEDMKTLLTLRNAGLPFAEIAGYLGRTVSSVESQFRLLRRIAKQ